MNSRIQTLVLSLLVVLPGLLGIDLLRAHNRHVEQGNAAFKSGKSAEALKLYDKALNDDGLADPQARAAAEFNRGAAFSSLGKMDEAGQAFLEATKSKDSNLRARAFYNLGNTFFKGEKFSEAIEAFKRSLVLDSRNSDAKWNLELALRKKKEQDEKDKENKDKKKDQDQDKNKQDPNKQDKPDNKDKDKQDKPDDKDKGKQDDQKQDQSKQDEQNQQKQDQQKQDDQKQDQPKTDEQDQQGKEGKKPQEEPKPPGQDKPQEGKAAPADMKEINAVLDSLEQSPRQIEQQRARVRAMQRRAPVKDW